MNPVLYFLCVHVCVCVHLNVILYSVLVCVADVNYRVMLIKRAHGSFGWFLVFGFWEFLPMKAYRERVFEILEGREIITKLFFHNLFYITNVQSLVISHQLCVHVSVYTHDSCVRRMETCFLIQK